MKEHGSIRWEKEYMTFSIIVVCYNAGEKLQKTISSIRSQTEKDYEIIVEDGLSTDGSVEAIVPGDDLKVFRERDEGIYDAMNRAAARASGAYLFFLNCGDYFENETVLARVRHFIGNDSYGQHKTGESPRIFYGNIRERATGAAVMSNPVIDDFACYRNVPCHQACFYDRRLLEKRRFHTCYRVRADYEHFLWCYYRARAGMVYMPVTVVAYEGGGFSETKESKKRSAVEHRHIVQKYMTKKQILRYRLLLLLTLAPLRTYLAGNPVTAGAYQRVKTRFYKRNE